MCEFKEHAINHFNTINKINNSITKNEGVKTTNLVKPFFNEFEKISIDFAVMEKSNNIYVVPCSIDWDDVGNYKAFDDLFKHDENGNVVVDSTLVSVDSRDNIIINSKANQKISIMGISNKVIVCTDKNIMIVDKDKISQLKQLVINE
jgi:mannose-1-phosphate guanylyltransferase